MKIKLLLFLAIAWLSLISANAQSYAYDSLYNGTWGEDAPYNQRCPVYAGSPTYPGPVAVALAQLCHYYRYPANPTGNCTYTFGNHGVELGLDSVMFNYDLMPNRLTNDSSAIQKEEVAELIYATAVATGAQFDPEQTGWTIGMSTIQAMHDNFGYTGGTLISRDTDSNFVEVIMNEMRHNRLVIMYGVDTGQGFLQWHVWLCTGYHRTQDRVRMNWGWGGFGNAYYDMQGINFYIIAAGYNFNRHQGAIIGLIPPKDSTDRVVYFHQVSLTSNDTTQGYVVGGGEHGYMQPDTITAVPYNGFVFSHWGDGDTTNPRVFTVKSDTAFMAFFDTARYEVSIATTDGGYVVLSCADTEFVVVDSISTMMLVGGNTTLTLSSVASEGYVFSHWSNGIMENPVTLTVVSDTTMIAYFTREEMEDTTDVGVDDIDDVNIKVYMRGQQVIVEGAEHTTVCLYDIKGTLLAAKRDEYDPLRFEVPASGTYLIKVGDHPARRVVVVR